MMIKFGSWSKKYWEWKEQMRQEEMNWKTKIKNYKKVLIGGKNKRK